MARGPRILLEHVYYHVVNRGNQKQKVFFEESDFQKYLQILKHYKKRYNFKLFGYCLMPNHVHMILEPKQPSDLARVMQSITQTYSTWFNNKYRKVGHLWQGRFKSMVIQKDRYFMECVYYVEANPVRAELISSPLEYRWSSYKERVFFNKGNMLDLPDST
jgi:putative transposase